MPSILRRLVNSSVHQQRHIGVKAGSRGLYQVALLGQNNTRSVTALKLETVFLCWHLSIHSGLLKTHFAERGSRSNKRNVSDKVLGPQKYPNGLYPGV